MAELQRRGVGCWPYGRVRQRCRPLSVQRIGSHHIHGWRPPACLAFGEDNGGTEFITCRTDLIRIYIIYLGKVPILRNT